MFCTDILRSEMGNTSILHLRLSFIVKLDKWCWLTYLWVLYQTLQKSVDICLHAFTKTNDGENSDNQMEFTSNRFFSSLNYLNFSLLQQSQLVIFLKVILFQKIFQLNIWVIGRNIANSNKENVEVIFLKKCFGTF